MSPSLMKFQTIKESQLHFSYSPRPCSLFIIEPAASHSCQSSFPSINKANSHMLLCHQSPPNHSLTLQSSQFLRSLTHNENILPPGRKNMNSLWANKIAENTISSRKRIHHFYCRKMEAGLENEFYFYEKQRERERAAERETLMK